MPGPYEQLATEHGLEVIPQGDGWVCRNRFECVESAQCETREEACKAMCLEYHLAKQARGGK